MGIKKPRLKKSGLNWWALRGSNSRPSRCKRDALPTELSARLTESVYTKLKTINQVKNLKNITFFSIDKLTPCLYN